MCVVFLTCSTVIPLGELDLDLVLPGDVLDTAAFGSHDGAVVALRDRHLHIHLGLLRQRENIQLETFKATLNGFLSELYIFYLLLAAFLHRN